MKNISKYKIDTSLLLIIISLAIISIITIYSSLSILPSYMNNLAIRQAMWYILGFIVAYFIMFIGNQTIFKYANILYVIGVISLLLLLIYAQPINNIQSWFQIPGIGTFQPSEFMKIILIIKLGKMLSDFHEQFHNPSYLEEFIFIIKVMIIVLIPSILTFLQPDTGVVLIYIIIAITMLFIGGIRYRWFGLLGVIGITTIAFILGVYFINEDLFINIFGTDFFLRVDRLLEWSNQSGYQLEQGMSAIGSGGLFGHGFNNTPIYFPEPQTDFIFAVFASNFGLIGSLSFLLLIAGLDIKLINIALKTDKHINKYILGGIIGMLLYQQVQNIGMTMGLLPITGITLPFISYGGSSLISYMIMAGIFFNISNENLRFTN